MKKLFITLALAAATFVGANAQLFVGGDLGVQVQATKQDDKVKDDVNWGFSIDPKIGYELSDKLSAGAYISSGYTSTEDKILDTKSSAFNWGILPFVRYNVINFGKFGIAAEATVGVAGVHYDNGNNNPSDITLGINVAPYLTYAYDEHWEFEAGLSFLSLGYNFTSHNPDQSGVENTYTHNFGLGVDLDNIATLGAIRIGAIYKF